MIFTPLLFVFSPEFKANENSIYNAPLVLMSQSSSPDFWLQVQHYYSEKKYAPQIVQIVNEFHSAIAWATTGKAVTIIPKSMMPLLAITPELKYISVDDVKWELGVMWRKHTQRKALNDFISQLKMTSNIIVR
nr:LysR substrate-binding domain-containing protein [Escherichia coli]